MEHFSLSRVKLGQALGRHRYKRIPQSELVVSALKRLALCSITIKAAIVKCGYWPQASCWDRWTQHWPASQEKIQPKHRTPCITSFLIVFPVQMRWFCKRAIESMTQAIPEDRPATSSGISAGLGNAPGVCFETN